MSPAMARLVEATRQTGSKEIVKNDVNVHASQLTGIAESSASTTPAPSADDGTSLVPGSRTMPRIDKTSP
jgi:hypothetical protein